MGDRWRSSKSFEGKTMVDLPKDPAARVLFLLDKASETLDSARKITQEKRFAVARRDIQYGIEFLSAAYTELNELAEK